MVDTRIAARLVDPAALRSGPIASELSSDEVAAALRPHLDPTVMAPELPLLFPSPSGSRTLDAPGDAVDSDGGPSIPARRDDLPHAAPAIPAPAAATLEAAGILLPSDSLVSSAGSPPSAGDSPPIGEFEALASQGALTGRDIASGWSTPVASLDGTSVNDIGPAGSWPQRPPLIEPSTLLPTSDPRPVGPRIDRASGPSNGMGLDPAPVEEPGWTSPASPVRPGIFAGGPDGPSGWKALAPASFPEANGSRGVTDADALGEVASRLARAVERLEAAAEHLARQADRSSSPAPRPFRGRAAD